METHMCQADKLVGGEPVALSILHQSFQMGAATTKFMYIVTDSDLYIKRKGKWVNVLLKVFWHY